MLGQKERFGYLERMKREERELVVVVEWYLLYSFLLRWRRKSNFLLFLWIILRFLPDFESIPIGWISWTPKEASFFFGCGSIPIGWILLTANEAYSCCFWVEEEESQIPIGFTILIVQVTFVCGFTSSLKGSTGCFISSLRWEVESALGLGIEKFVFGARSSSMGIVEIDLVSFL